ncbi:MAG: type I restriction endonuclease subunit R [Candidatus Viridilinea halotolerans]|uniref:Type I restriction enzyme endonuclease subunit n=1 Tax=Candidatus Viridilinea halotolerans TaxID=2491704 RepID=A0A426U3S6_9CHLR|nr:MAG: type I restriction endonuclease subunit R [Candidatus Viridilinea halotolerans]
MFNEANSVEHFIRDLLAGKPKQTRDAREGYGRDSAALSATGLGWRYIPSDQLPRQPSEVLVEAHLRDALLRLNPEIAAQPARADEVLYKLRAIILAVRGDGLVRANEEFIAWLRGERTMPFGPNNQHTSVNLIDFDQLTNNEFVVTTQYTYKAPEKRFDLVLLVNGIPLVIGEAKTPVRPAISWVDGASDIADYEQSVPTMFVSNVFSFATEGRTYRYGSIRMPIEIWAPWREGDGESPGGLGEVEQAVRAMLRPTIVLDILRSFTVFSTDRQKRKNKLICRYQQYQAANQIVQRVVEGQIKKGLIWHFQGSGKSLLMLFAAQKLRLHPALKNPTVLIVVDRLDLDTQISATFNAADVPNTVAAATREELQRLLAQDARKVIITTIFRFAEAEGQLNARANIIVLVDEAHRTQEGDLGRKMREALPNAFLFGLTGTPINKTDRNTFFAFGADEDSQGYLSRYSFEESIRDKATLPLHFEPRLVHLHIEKEALNAAFAELTGHLSEDEYSKVTRQAARIGVLVKSPERINAVVKDIVAHYQTNVAPNGFKAQVVCYDREACVRYKEAMDKLLPPEASAVVMTVSSGEQEFKAFDRSKSEEEALLDRFRDPKDPLQILIVTAKLLTGFDAPILHAMYLDKLLKEHTLLQAICRTNRPHPGKTHGLIVDYLGVFDDVAKALGFDEKEIQNVIANLQELRDKLPAVLANCMAHFPGMDRSLSGYEGLMAAQEHLPNSAARDAFAKDFSVLNQIWEALSPDPILQPHEADYKWLSQVYESVKPPSGNGRLLWHSLGAKTLELIHEHIHVEAVRDDLDTLVMDADVLADLLQHPDPKKTREIEIKLIARLRKHKDNPAFIELGQRLEELRDQHERGILNSINFLKQLLDLAKEVVETEQQVDPAEDQDKAIAALTELFNELRGSNTPVVVERIVADIDAIVKVVRFPGWQQTSGGEREVKQALRKTLLKYTLHQEQDLFDRAYAYIAQYY